MKRRVAAITICFVFLFCLPNSVYANSKAQCYIETTSKRVLYAENENDRMPIASTTKIMTAIIAIEYGDAESTVVISKEASLTGGSCIGLKEGYAVTLNDLLIATMFVSGNDGAYAIAEHIGGTIENFCSLMNKKAVQIGCKNTNFCNPHGLPNDNHYSTAYDLSLIAAYAIQNERFKDIVSSQNRMVSINGIEWYMTNKNGFLKEYESAIGIKTGYTNAAGRCFVSAAEKNGMTICGVVLNCDSIYEESKNKMEELFALYKMEKILNARDHLFNLDVKNSDIKNYDIYSEKDIFLPLKEGEKATVKFDKVDFIVAPTKQNIPIGFINISINDDFLYIDTVYLRDFISAKSLTMFKFLAYFKLIVKFLT